MGFDWFKVDTQFHRHPKIRKAGRDGKDMFLWALARNMELEADGIVPDQYFDPDYCGPELHMSTEEVCNGMQRAQRAGLLRATDATGGGFEIVGWDDEWRPPMSSTQRSRRHRARRKRATAGNYSPTQRDATECNGHGTDATNATQEKRREEIRGDEKRDGGARRTSAKRGTQIPDSWVPNDDHRSLATELRLDCDTCALEFRDHAVSKGRVLKNWDAGFRNWLRKTAEWRTSGKPAGGPDPDHVKPSDLRALREKLESQGL